jgi:hypothetical protein
MPHFRKHVLCIFTTPVVVDAPTDDIIRVGLAQKLKLCRQCLNLSSPSLLTISAITHVWKLHISVLCKLLAVKIRVHDVK